MKLTPITNPVALRRDTAIGTRIFAGTTMIHGDTGWRDITELITPGSLDTEGVTGGRLYRVRRYGDAVYWVFRFRPHASRIGSTFGLPIMVDTVPVGFRETPISYIGFGATISGNAIVGLSNGAGAARLSITNLGVWEDRTYTVSGSYTTSASWPTTLPGLPV